MAENTLKKVRQDEMIKLKVDGRIASALAEGSREEVFG